MKTRKKRRVRRRYAERMIILCYSVLLFIYFSQHRCHSLIRPCSPPSSFQKEEVGDRELPDCLLHRPTIFKLKEGLHPISWFVKGLSHQFRNFAVSRYVRNGIDFLDETVARHAVSRQESFVSHRSGPLCCRSVETGSMRMIHVDESLIFRCHQHQFIELSENDRDTSGVTFVRIKIAHGEDLLLDGASNDGE